MLTLLASVAVLAGISATHNMGEQGVSPAVVIEGGRGSFGAEGQIIASQKVETQDGWIGKANLDYWQGPLSLGVGYTRRETSAWHKDVLWARASIRYGRLRLLAEVAPLSDRMEAKAEARIRIEAPAWGGSILFEPRAFVGWHTVAEELGGYSYGVSALVGWGQ